MVVRLSVSILRRSDIREQEAPNTTAISIHAPAKGATTRHSAFSIAVTDFNPRSREGSDFNAQCCQHSGNNFNPRSREGSDSPYPLHHHFSAISIHAPAKGATLFCAVSPLLDVFQSTLPRRERRDEKSRHESSYAFQSTLPRRERLSVGFFQLVLHNFNPRSREGSDPSATCCRWMSRNFNPRSREGSDHDGRRARQSVPISIHAPAKGATHRFK